MHCQEKLHDQVMSEVHVANTESSSGQVPQEQEKVVQSSAKTKPTVDLAKRRREQRELGGASSIKLERMSWQKGMPWGLKLDPQTLCFTAIGEGSVAKVFSGTMQLMVGLELDTINGRAVSNLEEVEKQLEKAGDQARFCFCKPLDPPVESPSEETVSAEVNLQLYKSNGM